MIVIDLPSKQLLHGAGHLLTAPHHTSDVVPWVVPQAHPAVAAVTIWDNKGVLDDAIVSLDVLVEG